MPDPLCLTKDPGVIDDEESPPIMLKKIALTGACAAAIIGAGGVALAETGSNSATPSASTGTSTASPTTPGKHAGHKGDKGHKGSRDRFEGRLKDVAHATWVSKDAKTGQYVTHDGIHGTVTAVSATSITVKAGDGVSETYVVNSASKVHVHTAGSTKGKATKSTIADVKNGDEVIVAGTGTGTLTANQVLDLRK